ncbi:MAG: ABC transporter permease [Lachnospiraceae bacterium]|nr:ABC transporter permease [Lachnospiraceae bacterium]
MSDRLKQIKIYFIKFLRLFVKTGGWKAFIFGGVISLIIAMVVGDNMFVYGLNTESGCFSLISACIWIGIFNSIQAICKERDIIKREHRSGMHISSYIISRALYELLICIIQAVIMLVICIIFLDFPEEGLVTGNIMVDVFITFFLVLLSSDYLGIAVSSIVKTTTTAMTVMPFILIVQLVLSGVLFALEGNAALIAKITISKWGMEALGSISNMDGLPYNAAGWMIIPRDAYAYESGHVISAWLIILGFSLLYLLIGIVCLKFVDKDKR